MKQILLIVLLLCPVLVTAQDITTFAGNGLAGNTGDGGPATAARMSFLSYGFFDKYGNCYLAMGVGGHKLRKISPDGIVTTIAGTGTAGYSGDNGPASAAQFNAPESIAMDTSGNIYISDSYNQVVRRIDGLTGIVTTVAGTGAAGYSGDNGPATAAQLNIPGGITCDKRGNVYVADYNNARIRRIDANGIITTFAGTGVFGYNGDEGHADTSQIRGVTDVFYSSSNQNLYMADEGNGRVRYVDTSGIIHNIAGNGMGGYSGDGGPATAAQVEPHGITVDPYGNIYFSDYYTYHIRRVDASGIISTITGTGVAGYNGDNIPATSAQIRASTGLFLDSCGNFYFCDGGNYRVRRINYTTSATPPVSVSLSTGTGDTVCAGTIVTYSTSVAGGGANVNYTWAVNGAVVSGATGSSYSYTPAPGDTVRCAVSSYDGCSLPSTATSNGVVLWIRPVVTPVVNISVTPNDTVCAGTMVTFTTTATGGGATPAYQWYRNGEVVATGSSYSYVPANRDSVRCVLTGSASCATTPMAGSSTITLSVNPVVTPAVSISVTPNDTVCAGTTATFTATATGGGATPAYQWCRNGTVVAAGNSYSYVPANGDSVRCVLTGSASCATAPMAGSSTITLSVNPVVMPAISISVTPNDTVCVGTMASFSSSISSGGAGPSYQWLVNGTAVGSSSGYSYIPANGDVVICVLTGNAPCATATMAASNVVTMSVDTMSVPLITLGGPSSASPGSTVTLTAVVTGAGSGYVLQWYKNGTAFALTTADTVSYVKGDGTDTLTVTVIPVAGACSDTAISPEHIVTCDVSGIALSNLSAVRLRPNPVRDEVFISGLPGSVNYRLYTSAGQLVTDGTIQNSGAINMRNLSAGIYMLELHSARDGRVMVKVVKE